MAKCLVCSHPAMNIINGHLGQGQKPYAEIIELATREFPDRALTKPQLSKHRRECLGLAPSPRGPRHLNTKELVAEVDIKAAASVANKIPLADALAIIIALGVQKAISDPNWLKSNTLIKAIEVAARLGLGTDEMTKFEDAWAKLGETQAAEKPRVIDPNVVEALIEEEE